MKISPGQVPNQIQINWKKWKWMGHALRKHHHSVTTDSNCRQALKWNPQGSWKRRHPKQTPGEEIFRLRRRTGATPEPHSYGWPRMEQDEEGK